MSKMADEEKYRVEPQDVEEKEEKKGLFRPLPQPEQEFRKTDGKRPQPVVRLLGIPMYEKHRDILLILLMPMLTGLIDTAIYSFVIVSAVETSATYMFFLPALAAIPIGLAVSETGPALVSAFLSAIFFIVFYVIFLASPGILLPELGITDFIISGIAFAVGAFILVVVASILGVVIGVIVREFA